MLPIRDNSLGVRGRDR